MKSILLLLSALLLGQLASCSKEPPKPTAQDVALGYYQKFISEQHAIAEILLITVSMIRILHTSRFAMMR